MASLAELKKQAPATELSLGSLAITDKAQVIVIGTVYSGTYIEICHVSFIVHQSPARAKAKARLREGLCRKPIAVLSRRLRPLRRVFAA